MARVTGTPLKMKRTAVDISASPTKSSQKQTVPTTPGTRPKRVRFSNPGPTLSSTGLTPFIQRTSFSGSSPPPDDIDVGSPESACRRRQSAPNLGLARQLYSRLDSQANHGDGVELFVAPLKDVLSDRVKRRMARRGLSDEVNSWESEKRETQKLKREVRRLSELIEKKDIEMDIQPYIADEDVPELTDESFEESDIQDQSLVLFTEPTTPMDEHSIQTIVEASDIDALTSAYEAQSDALIKARLSIESLIPSDPPLPLLYSSPDDVLSIDTSSPALSTPCILDFFTSTITDLHTSLSKAQSLLTSTKTQESNLRSQFNNALAALEHTRTKSATEVKLIKQVAREKFQEMHSKSVQDDATIAALQTNITARDDKISELTSEIESSKQDTTQLSDTLATLESETLLHESTIEKLNTALSKYRSDITSLETLITQMENQHTHVLHLSSTELKDTRALAHAETRGRHVAESALSNAELRIKSLEVAAEELRLAVDAKQLLIREMETVISGLEDEAQCAEQSLGTLNVKIGLLEAEREEYALRARDMHGVLRAEVNGLLERLDAVPGMMSPETPSRARAMDSLVLPFHASPSKSKSKSHPQLQKKRVQALGLITPSTPRSTHIPSSVTFARGNAGKKEARSANANANVNVNVSSSSPTLFEIDVASPPSESDFWNRGVGLGLSKSFPPLGFCSAEEIQGERGGRGRVLSPVME